MLYEYDAKGICAQKIFIDLNDDGTVANVEFLGGCHGNHQGINNLVKGMQAEEVISRLEGIRCGMKASSCPDQLAQALKELI